jgi:putative transposase
MSEHHRFAAFRFVELTPVGAGLAKEVWSYKWSSAAAHIEGRGDRSVRVDPVVTRRGCGDRRSHLDFTRIALLQGIINIV